MHTTRPNDPFFYQGVNVWRLPNVRIVDQLCLSIFLTTKNPLAKSHSWPFAGGVVEYLHHSRKGLGYIGLLSVRQDRAVNRYSYFCAKSKCIPRRIASARVMLWTLQYLSSFFDVSSSILTLISVDLGCSAFGRPVRGDTLSPHFLSSTMLL